MIFFASNHKSSRGGFTLIELLVVIAIIGLLSSVVLASLNSARNKAKDASLKLSANELRKLLAFEYSDNQSYANLQRGWVTLGGGTCSNIFSGTYASQATGICNNITAIASTQEGISMGYGGALLLYTGTTDPVNNFSIMIPLNNGNWYCLGSSGRVGEYSAYTSQPGCYNNP